MQRKRVAALPRSLLYQSTPPQFGDICHLSHTALLCHHHLMTPTLDLKHALFAEREASFFRLKGGFPIPLAGAVYWIMLGTVGYLTPNRQLWIFVAFWMSGIMFPIALLFAKLFRNNFMRERTAVTDAIFPAFASMLLFWPIAISAWWTYPPIVPLILAIGMSTHWPIIGWMYGRTALFTTHAVVRAIACFILWNWFPSTRFTLLPFTVAFIYLVTVIAIFFASSAKKHTQATEALAS